MIVPSRSSPLKLCPSWLQYYNTVFLSLVQLHTKESLFGVTSAALEAAIEAAPFPVTLVAVHGGGKGPQGVSKAAKVGQAEDAGQAGRSKAQKGEA